MVLDLFTEGDSEEVNYRVRAYDMFPEAMHPCKHFRRIKQKLREYDLFYFYLDQFEEWTDLSEKCGKRSVLGHCVKNVRKICCDSPFIPWGGFFFLL